MINTIIRFANIILAALLAGTSFGIWIGLNPKNYSAATYIEQQQNLVLSLNSVMVSLVILATVMTTLSAILHRKNKFAFIALLLASALFASCIFISRLGNFPIQAEMLSWNVDQLPADWKLMRDKWWSLHRIRTVVELLALLLVAWTSVQKERIDIH